MKDYILILSEGQITNNWDLIQKDIDNPYKDIKTPEEFIEKIKNDEVVILGAKVVLAESPVL